MVAAATAELTIGFLVYCAGADPDFAPFLSNSIDAAEAMVYRNCLAPMRLCHHFAPAMVERGSGGIVVFGSGAGFVGGPDMVAYGASKAFDMVFAEALWSELHDKGVDVIGLILGKTDTPALRKLEHQRGLLASEEQRRPTPRRLPRSSTPRSPTCPTGPPCWWASRCAASVRCWLRWIATTRPG